VAAALTALRAEVAAIDPDLPVFEEASIQQVIDGVEWNGRVSERLVRSITSVALLLAVAGLYTVIAHSVSRRATEIAIRMTLGARSSHVHGVVAREALGHLALGLGLGVLLILLWDSASYSGRAGLRVSDWRVLLPAMLVLSTVALIACAVPARRAARLDPQKVLRET
jgi:putative ABC transport system permease protein